MGKGLNMLVNTHTNANTKFLKLTVLNLQAIALSISNSSTFNLENEGKGHMEKMAASLLLLTCMCVIVCVPVCQKMKHLCLQCLVRSDIQHTDKTALKAVKRMKYKYQSLSFTVFICYSTNAINEVNLDYLEENRMIGQE